MEFMGLNLLVGINKVDAISGLDCPSLDADVKDSTMSTSAPMLQ